MIRISYHSKIRVIKSFKHRGLKRLYANDDRSGINANQYKRLRRLLASLDAAEAIAHLRLPDYKLHALHGDRRGFCAISVSGNWRIEFRFEAGNAYDVDLVNYR